MSTNMTGFRFFSWIDLCILALKAKVALALDGLRQKWVMRNHFLQRPVLQVKFTILGNKQLHLLLKQLLRKTDTKYFHSDVTINFTC